MRVLKPDNHIEKVPVGTLIEILCDAKVTNISFDEILVCKNQIGLIVEKDVWPDETWPRRDEFQAHGPYYKVLLGRQIILVSDGVLHTTGTNKFVRVFKRTTIGNKDT